MEIIHFEIDQHGLHSLDLPNQTTKYIEAPLAAETAKAAHDASIVSVFVNSLVDQTVIDSLPNLKLLVTRSTGFDHIDVAYAQSKGIIVCNVPAYGSRTVAEFTFALLLGLSRKVFQAVEQIKHKNNWDISHFEGFNLQGKTIGIVGTGRIGLNVAQIAKGFDMTIIAHDVFPNEEKAKAYGFSYVPFSELLATSDIITFHVPATKDTYHLINRENIKQLKKGALIINTARGDVLDPEAILIALKQGVLAGAALDVLEGEHDLKEEAELMSDNKLNFDKLKMLLDDHMLIDHPQVIITPHIAFNTAEARAEITKTTLENIQSFLDEKPQNIVTLSHE